MNTPNGMNPLSKMSRFTKIALLGALLFGAPGCATDGFCFDKCDGNKTGTDAGPIATHDGGPPIIIGGGDAAVCTGPNCTGQGDGGNVGPTCKQTNAGVEVCDGKDNDCNGKIDDNIDFTDPRHCGTCDTNCFVSLKEVVTPSCTPPASGLGSTPGTCGYDKCAPNFYDVDGNPANGCEYKCTWNPSGTNTQDLGAPFGCGHDDDCDGLVDEDVDVCSDPLNCGACGNTCVLANATAACVTTAKAGEACVAPDPQNKVVGNTSCAVKKCAAGFVDQDGIADNGCEYSCTPSNGGVEICDGKDNDCDGLIDNADSSLNDPLVGIDCQGGDKGICADTVNKGVSKCIDGRVSCCDLDSNNVQAANPKRYPDTGLNNNMCRGAVGPFVVVPGAKKEICNALDDDCDGFVDALGGTPTSDAGGVCGTGIGTCHTGHNVCVTVVDGNGVAQSASLQCPDATGPSPLGELCDGLDDDCDGVIDGTAPKTKQACQTDADCTTLPDIACVQLSATVGDKGCVAPPKDIVDQTTGAALACDVPPPPPAGVPQPCLAGKRACFGGTPVCVGSVTQQQPTDKCFEDTNCDGTLTNQTGLVNADVHNCGACGNDCTKNQPNANWQCLAGVCKQSGCATGFIECGGASPTDCETACTFDQTDELCDGKDNNCNCQIDEGNIPAPSVVQACGVSQGAISDPGCNANVNVKCTAGAWKCTFTDPAYCTTGNCKTTPDICDGKDNNCNGVVDEPFLPPNMTTSFKGQGCFSDDGKALKDGVCQTAGTFVCTADGKGTTCSAVKDTSKISTDICNGKDDDCNGLVDDTNSTKDPRLGAACFGGTQGICALPANAGTVGCVLGAPVCSGAKLVVPGQVPETCNGLDDDCNGTKDDNLTDIGALCGTSIGECTTGVNVCANAGTPTAVVQCGVHVTPVVETCNGRDDNCNGVIDDNPIDVGSACNVPKPPPAGATSPCKAGVLACIGSTPVCQGSVVPQAGVIDACGEDTNCNGVLENQTGRTDNDVLNCGACGNDCNTKDPAGNSTWSCNAGVCVHTGCKTGFIDCDANANTCERACTVTSSTEICNGKDDNCNCQIDDNVPAVTSIQVCGVSAGATDPNCTGNVTPVCTAGAWKCTFPAGYCTTGNCSTTTDTCDGKDNNCNGVVDESFKAPILTSGFLGQSCTTPATDGPCQGSGSYVCNGAGTATVCSAVKDNTKSKPEICNNIDDNCNGVVDDSPTDPTIGNQCFASNVGLCGTAAHAGAIACKSGALVCSGANLLSPFTLPETCNGVDDDCNGTIDNNPTDVGAVCGSGVGACTPGKTACVSGAPVCQGAVAGTAEKCNGVDDDCNGTIDDNPTDVGGDCSVPPAAPAPTAQCATVTEPCKKGKLACSGGVPVCQGSVTASSSTPDGCCTDSNCDGVLTNQPDFQTDVKNCGACGNDCNAVNAGSHGVWACVAGACQRTACSPGYINCDGVASDCEKQCTFSGAELCNGVDDDCNCAVDDNVASVPQPSQVCGVSAAASDPKCKVGDGTTGVLVACNAGAWKCTFPTGYCDKGSPALCSTTPDICDNNDNNCNGATDENFKLPTLASGYLGQACASDDGQTSQGACRTTGSYVCNGTAATKCSAVINSGAAGPELCDGVDNDCDGKVDEPFSSKGSNATYFVKPAVVKVSNSLWVYQYEASRPNATAAVPGSGDGYWTSAPSGQTLDKTASCSASGKIPWFNVTPTEVEQTCSAMGGKICGTTDWTTSCQAGNSCKWGYSPTGSCSTAANYAGTPFCNLGAYDFNGVANTDGLLPTASTTPGVAAGPLKSCFATLAAGSLFDITGNLREITFRAAGDYPLMGGAFNTNAETGAQCDFSFYSVPATFKFFDTGFRCCFTADPTL